MPKTFDKLTAIDKVAILLIALGEDTSAEILRNMTDDESTRIVEAIAAIGYVNSDTMNQVLEEFELLLKKGQFVSQGGAEFARSALELAMGPERAQRVMDRIGQPSTGLGALHRVDPKQILPIVRKEHPQTIALILAQLPPTIAAGVLSGLEEEMQSDVIYRMATLKTVSPEALRELEDSLSEELQTLLSGHITTFDGPKTVAAILNRAKQSTEWTVIDHIAQSDPEMAEAIRSEMFIFDDIVHLADGDMGILLKQIDPNDLALALKTADKKIQNRFFSALSKNRAAMLKEEIGFLGKVRLSDVQNAQQKIAQTVRELQENGHLRVVRNDSDDILI